MERFSGARSEFPEDNFLKSFLIAMLLFADAIEGEIPVVI